MRKLGAALVINQCEEAALAEVAAAARALAARLRDRGVPRNRAARIRALAPTPPGKAVDANGAGRAGPGLVPDLPERPIGGPINPGSAPTLVRWDGESVLSAEVVIDAQFSGGDGRVHGGVIAGMFDDILSHVVTALGVPAVTGRLSVAYRAPTPIGVPIIFKGTVERQSERVITVHGEARHGETVTATAELTMIVVDEDRFACHSKPI